MLPADWARIRSPSLELQAQMLTARSNSSDLPRRGSWSGTWAATECSTNGFTRMVECACARSYASCISMGHATHLAMLRCMVLRACSMQHVLMSLANVSRWHLLGANFSSPPPLRRQPRPLRTSESDQRLLDKRKILAWTSAALLWLQLR
jgi:hypothetical protein